MTSSRWRSSTTTSSDDLTVRVGGEEVAATRTELPFVEGRIARIGSTSISSPRAASRLVQRSLLVRGGRENGVTFPDPPIWGNPAVTSRRSRTTIPFSRPRAKIACSFALPAALG